ncbi:MAG: GNAT family N-acetyltransferase [Micromonosporaceae bacterium]
MRCVITKDLREYAERVLPWLHAEPVGNNVACTVIGQRLEGMAPIEPDAIWAYVVDPADQLVGAAVRTPPHGLLLSTMPTAAADILADALAAHPPVPYANGPAAPTERFATRYSALTGRTTKPGPGSGIYRLEQLVPPEGVSGELRAAGPGDRDLLVAWAEAFGAEDSFGSPQHMAREIDSRLRRKGLLWLWYDDGQPVTTAWLSLPAAGVVRISGVYTPPRNRRRGYASGCVAALSRHALDAGATACMLYTDLANPTSNGIYRRLGYQRVGESTMWRFE